MKPIIPVFALLSLACAPAMSLPAQEVRPGVDVLADEPPAVLAGKRIGLITNQTGVGRDGRPTIDILAAAPGLQLVALFSPEHGIRGVAAEGERVTSGRDERTGLPIHSLYGETRKPTAEMLRGVQALVFDIQDVGARPYTYVSTMALGMQAAKETGIPFVVLDRPNPIGGAAVEGGVLNP
ncbi:MAG TPA: exo-beta-N-acetylmuramidase NamZ domain-containing protein, partial [Longimicrobium sp.]|nr:exo-beta-N-acetylmuramidase NamZ domain-containing protein [Longimicrobium sp.]